MTDFIKMIFESPLVSAFAGGFFAAFWTNRYEGKRRMNELRLDKYIEHRNTIVQMEHELIPERVSMSRNLASFREFEEGTNESRIRVLLRLYKLALSPGLTIKLLSMDLLNEYANLYSMIESINLDIVYHDDLTEKILAQAKYDNIDESMLVMYVILVENLYKNCQRADEHSIRLLAKCKAIVDLDDKKVKAEYIKTGGAIEYSIPNATLENTLEDITNQEKPTDKNDRLQFVAPYMDIIKPMQ